MSSSSHPHALIFANGDLNDGLAVRAALSHAPDPLIVAADGGARHALALGLRPHLVIGDFDSLSQTELQHLIDLGAEIQRHSAHKDETDLELALLSTAARVDGSIFVIGAVGDRLDQTLGNVYLLALPELRGRDVRLLSGRQTTRLAYPGKVQIDGQPGDTLSLLPLGGDVEGITTENLEYPLRNETLRFGPARGVSNVLTSHSACVQFKQGILLLIHTIGRA